MQTQEEGNSFGPYIYSEAAVEVVQIDVTSVETHEMNKDSQAAKHRTMPKARLDDVGDVGETVDRISQSRSLQHN